MMEGRSKHGREVFTGCRWEARRENTPLEDLGISGRITKWILGRQELMGQTRFSWLRKKYGGGLS
jgi:hypothetical protein